MDLEISVEEFERRMKSNAPPVLLDVRETWEVEAASLPGALNIPMQEVPARAFNELDEDTPILVFCHHGARSMSVAVWLQNQGFTQTQSIAGGIDAYSRLVDPAIPRY